MRAGFNWELGPFEMWDAAGVRETVARMKALGMPASRSAGDLMDSAHEPARFRGTRRMGRSASTR